MTARAPLPLRLVQSRWCSPTLTGSSSSSASASVRLASEENDSSRVIAVYKPSGLPYFARSQVEAAQDGRGLFAIHTGGAAGYAGRHASLTASSPPAPEDASDSLLTRATDLMLPGSTPYIAFPLAPPQVLRCRHIRCTAGAMNQWTARKKGVTVIARTQADAFVLRNAARIGLVRSTYRVLCRLPPGVAHNARRSLVRAHEEMQERSARLAFSNLYLQDHLRAKERALHIAHSNADASTGGDSYGGICIRGEDGSVPSVVSSTQNPFISGGAFIDNHRGLLRRHGRVRAYVRTSVPLPSVCEEELARQRRLSSLFMSPVSTLSSHKVISKSMKRDGTRPACETDDEKSQKSLTQHPWLSPDGVLCVSADTTALARRAKRTSHASASAPLIKMPLGRYVEVAYELISVSSMDGNDTALYEVSGRDVTSEEVQALFAAQGFYVVNDYVHDTHLARTLEAVAAQIRSAPPALLADLPVGAQHRLRSATAEELIASPLFYQPLDLADAEALKQLGATSSISSYAGGGIAQSLEDRRDVHSEYYECITRKAATLGMDYSRNPWRRLLFRTLSRLHRCPVITHEGEEVSAEAAYAAALALTMGSGVECTGLSFPDPSYKPNIHALQYLAARSQHGGSNDALEEDEEGSAASRGARRQVEEGMHFITKSLATDGTGTCSLVLPCGFNVRPGESVSIGHSDGVVDVCLSYACALLAAGKVASPYQETMLRDALELTAVPAAHHDLFTTWMTKHDQSPPWNVHKGTTKVALQGEKHRATSRSEDDALLGSLFPPPRQLEEWVSGRADDGSDSKSVKHARASRGQPPRTGSSTETVSADDVSRIEPVSIFVRAEELSELSCARCGGAHHTWHVCDLRATDEMIPVSMQHQHSGASPPSSIQQLRLSKQVEEEVKSTGVDITVAELLVSVGDVEAALVEQDSARKLARQERAAAEAIGHVASRGIGGGSGGSVGDFSGFGEKGGLVAVPNKAVTMPMSNPHVRRTESRKPALHRRAIRCAYCGGRHHITECPKLSTPSASESGDDTIQHLATSKAPFRASGFATGSNADEGRSVVVDRARMRAESAKLFCIHCGQHGHLYQQCPRAPEGLHPSTHCPICRLPSHQVRHEPAQCPRRVTVPHGYTATGIPREFFGPVSALHSQNSGTQRRGGKSVGGRLGSQGSRGSMLIADSFVDSK